jgi:hypothetical protein
MIGKYRLHQRGSLARLLVSEAIGVLGKLIMDRSGLDLRARFNGFRTGMEEEAHGLPPLPSQARAITFTEVQRRRLRRRIQRR